MLREKSSSNLSSLDVEKFCYVGGHPEISTVDIRASAGKLLGFSGLLSATTKQARLNILYLFFCDFEAVILIPLYTSSFWVICEV